uniref:SH2 domain-containing protein n=2 Tax=Arion vulgaris TaxID=1028688 RepID=A0A0B7B2N1_9EUPU
MDNMVRVLKSNSDHLQVSTLEILMQLINDKRQAKKKYLDERNRLESEFAKAQDELAKNKAEYAKCVERLNIDKAKFMDMQSKSKPGPKVDEAKSKFFRSAADLHKIHNDYVLSVNSAQEHQTTLRDMYLPALLDCHQEEQEAFVHKVKFILADYLKHTDTSRADFQTFSKNIYNSIQAIQPGKEYSGTFVDLHRSSLSSPIDFTFDERLLDSYSGSLKANVIEINDLTVELLQTRLIKLTEEVDGIKKKILTLSTDQQKAAVEVNHLSARLGDDCTIEDVNNYLTKQLLAEDSNREILELEGSLKKLVKLASLIQQPLNKYGTGPAPPAMDLSDMRDGDDGSTSSSPPHHGAVKDGTFMTALGKMNLFKKTATKDGNGQSLSSIDDTTDDKPIKKKQPGYEKHVPSMTGPNSMQSMAQMRELGHLVDMNPSEAKTRIADELWFHGILPREEVQRLLAIDGDFLVRESKNKKTGETQFVLSVYWQGHRHFIIQFNPDQGWHFEGNAYPTIQELVHRQHESGRTVTSKSGVILQTPILREWELLNDDIELKVRIGSGNFGEVLKACTRTVLK